MIKKHVPLIIFLSFYFLIVAYKLISHPTPFYDWDESINAQVAKEMLEKKSLVPLWQGNPWLDKPPLPFLFFAIILKLTPFTIPEISLRITSLILSLTALIFVYAIFLKVLNRTSTVEERSQAPDGAWRSGRTAEVEKVMAVLIVIITSFTPIFLQRSQILNLDVFLLIGWLGYLLFVQNFWLGLFFLAIGVLSKSLLGFYPVVITFALNLFLLFKPPRLRSEAGEPRRLIRMALIQVGILSLWYLFMFLMFRQDFWQQHIIETHFRRITASIESHFGQKTFYVDLMFEQLGIFMWLAIIGFIFVISNAVRNLAKRKNYEWILYSLFLLPWFIFLNLTKTKIFWYLYPAIPQFAFLSVYPLSIIKDKKTLLYLLSVILIIFTLYQNFVKTNFFTTFYSKPEDHYRLALFAKDRCNSLSILVGKETREATKTLEKLGLLITSTKQWGDHPSTIYYFGKKVDFEYDENSFKKKLSFLNKKHCLMIQKNDLDTYPELEKFNIIKNTGSFYLLEP